MATTHRCRARLKSELSLAGAETSPELGDILDSQQGKGHWQLTAEKIFTIILLFWCFLYLVLDFLLLLLLLFKLPPLPLLLWFLTLLLLSTLFKLLRIFLKAHFLFPFYLYIGFLWLCRVFVFFFKIHCLFSYCTYCSYSLIYINLFYILAFNFAFLFFSTFLSFLIFLYFTMLINLFCFI